MERRSFLSLVQITGLALLTPKLAFADVSKASPGCWKDSVLQRIVLSEAVSRSKFSLRQKTAESNLWKLILVKEGLGVPHARIAEAFEAPSRQRRECLEVSESQAYTSLSQAEVWSEVYRNVAQDSLKDLGIYYEYRRALSFQGHPLPNLHNSEAFRLTLLLCQKLGHPQVLEEIIPVQVT